MKSAFKKNIIVFLSLIIVFLIVDVLATRSSRTIFIDGDGSGHYAYLPSIITYQTVDFTEVFEVEKSRRPPDYMGHYFHEYNDILINKYTSGTALLQLPFYLLAILVCIIIGIPADGYNAVFQFSIAISTIFYVSLGLFNLVKLLSKWGINKRFGWIVAIAGLFGTNLFFYTFVEPSFSHAYSFTVITSFLLSSKNLFTSYSRKNLLLSAFLYGLVILIRPANAIVILSLPFIAGNWYSFSSVIKKKVITLDYNYAALVFIVAISPQLIINWLQSGSLFIYGYKNEGFYFGDPQFINFMFSYRKGWLVYTPFFWLLIPGIIYMFRSQTKFASVSFSVFLIFQIYFLSSWWNWYYGDSFGMRPMVDFYTLYLLIIAIFINNACNKYIRVISFIYMGLAILLNLIQSYQYAKGIIHPSSMTSEAYWYVFLDINKEKSGAIACGDETFFGKLSNTPFFYTLNNIDQPPSGWSNNYTETNLFQHSGRLGSKQDQDLIYSPAFNYKIPDSLIGYKNLYIRFETKFLENEANSAINAVFVVDISDDSVNNIFYKSFKVKKMPDNITGKWRDGSIGFKLPEITNDMEIIKLYIWNVDKQSYYLDDLDIEFFTYHNP